MPSHSAGSDQSVGDGSSPAAHSLHLEVIAGNAAGTTIVVTDELVIGRHESGPGRLDDDIEISRQHARLSREQGGIFAIEDLGSTNGTFLNGLRLSGPGVLSVGDTIEVGATTVVVRPPPVEAGPEPSTGTDPTDVLVAPDAADVLGEPAQAEESHDMLGEPAQVEESHDAPNVAPPPVRVAPLLPPDAGPPHDSDPASVPPEHRPDTPLASPLAELRLEIDFDARQARLALGGASEELRLVYDDDRWRLEPPEE